MTEGSFFEKAWEGNSENDVIQFIRQLLEAVRCVHSHGLILGDLKPCLIFSISFLSLFQFFF